MAEEQAGQGGGVQPPGSATPRAAQTAAAQGPGGAPLFVDRGGPVLQNAHLVLIFWGRAWTAGPPVSLVAISNAVATIISSPYMDPLRQYRNVGRASLQMSMAVTVPIGSSPSDPPSSFADSDVATFIADLVHARMVPSPAVDPQLLYVVFMPPEVKSQGTFVGAHNFFDLSGTGCHYAWVANAAILHAVTATFSHELVEAVTDPQGNAITGEAGVCNQPGWCEIGDVCSGDTVTVNGVVVQRYWSQADGTCVPAVQAQQPNAQPTTQANEANNTEAAWQEYKAYWEGPMGGPEAQIGQFLANLDARVRRLEEAAAQGRAFVRPEERPPVGGPAVTDVPPSSAASEQTSGKTERSRSRRSRT